MSAAPVDVLAVLDLAACRERDAGMPDGVQIAARPALHDLGEALDRAAGLTLIEAGAALLLGIVFGLVIGGVYL